MKHTHLISRIISKISIVTLIAILTPMSVYAQAPASGGGDIFGFLMPLILVFIIFYFLLIRPQQRKQKAHRDMLSAVKAKDKIITSGGLIGTVTRVIDESVLEIEIATDIRVKIHRQHLFAITNRTDQPQNQKKSQDSADNKPSSGLLSFLNRKK